MLHSIWGYWNYRKLFLANDLFCFVDDVECVSCRYQTGLSGDNIKQIRESASSRQCQAATCSTICLSLNDCEIWVVDDGCFTFLPHVGRSLFMKTQNIAILFAMNCSVGYFCNWRLCVCTWHSEDRASWHIQRTVHRDIFRGPCIVTYSEFLCPSSGV
jgi:hypothetical protein